MNFVGLKMLLYILTTRNSRTYALWEVRVAQLVQHVTNYIRNSFNRQYGYFSQGNTYINIINSNTQFNEGGEYDAQTKVWTWVKEPYLAVDCQVGLYCTPTFSTRINF